MLDWKYTNTLVPYQESLDYMEENVAKIHGKNAPEQVWLLEHPNIYTAGVSANEDDLLDPNQTLIRTGRGGQITYHGPGMRIAYIMLDLKKRNNCDIKKYICNLESWLINSLNAVGVKGERRKGRVGIWVVDKNNPDHENKIAAIGVRVRKWVTYHGIAINVNPDLTKYDAIVPCGISDQKLGVTSLKKEGIDIALEEFDKILKQEFIKIFEG